MCTNRVFFIWWYTCVPIVAKGLSHFLDCSFCQRKILEHSMDPKSNVGYLQFHSALHPVTHFSENIHVSTPPPLLHQESYDNSVESTASPLISESLLTACDEEPHFSQKSVAPYLSRQKDLNGLFRDLGLTKDKSELFASQLKQWNQTKQRVNSTYFRPSQLNLRDYFPGQDSWCYSSNIDGLLKSPGPDHDFTNFLSKLYRFCVCICMNAKSNYYERLK